MVVPLAALGYAVTVGTLQQHTYVHVMAGILWTGFDLFIGAVLGPVIGGLDDDQSSAVFQRLTPKTAFLLPSLAFVTIAGGITLAQRIGMFPHAESWLALFTAVNLIPILLLLGWRLNAWTDRRWQIPFAVATIGSLAWVALTIDEFAMTEPAIAVALGIVTILSVQGSDSCSPASFGCTKRCARPHPIRRSSPRSANRTRCSAAFRASSSSS